LMSLFPVETLAMRAAAPVLLPMHYPQVELRPSSVAKDSPEAHHLTPSNLAGRPSTV
jgi:hypothetical protein